MSQPNWASYILLQEMAIALGNHPQEQLPELVERAWKLRWGDADQIPNKFSADLNNVPTVPRTVGTLTEAFKVFNRHYQKVTKPSGT